MKKYDVVTIGGVVEDTTFFVNQGKLLKDSKKDIFLSFELGTKVDIKKTYLNLGGGAANTAVGCNNFGLNTGMVTRVGNDDRGKYILKELKKLKLDTSLVQTDQDEHTGFSFICGFEKNKLHAIFSYRGAASKLRFDAKTLENVKTRWMHVTSLKNKNWPELMDNIASYAKKNQTGWSWNPGGTQLLVGAKKLAKYLKVVDILLVNRAEAEELVGGNEKSVSEILKKLSKFGPKIVVITDGAKGAYVFESANQKEYYHKALAKKIVDTTGAGDAFASGFISGMLMYKDIKKALKLGMANSQGVLKEVGAQHGLLTKADLTKVFK
ncbi:MAG: carbohydrate kinase family protein [Patescibacteria group bacterium]